MRRRESRRLIEHFSKMAGHYRRLSESGACWRADNAGIEYTEAESAELSKASEHLEAARKIVQGIYAKRIGDAVTSEIVWP